MKRLLLPICFLLCVITAFGQDRDDGVKINAFEKVMFTESVQGSGITTGVAYYLQRLASAPQCFAVGQLYYKTTATAGPQYCSVVGSPGTWNAFATGGTVTSVSGTTNQIDVATGTTTPVLSFPTNGIIANNVSPGLLSTATAAGTTTLTVASKGIQVFTGSTTQTVVLPVVTTLPQLGFGFVIQNDSSGALTVNSSGGNLVQTMAAGTRAFFTCKLLTGTSAASWNVGYSAAVGSANGATVLIPGTAEFQAFAIKADGAGGGGGIYSADANNDSLVVVGGAIFANGAFSISTSGVLQDSGANPSVNTTSRQLINGLDAGSTVAIDWGSVDHVITAAASTESLAIDGVAHTVITTAATAISNVTVLWEAGAGGTEFRINGDGFISRYGDSALTNGQILIGGAASGALAAATLTPGTGISVTNGDGSITIAADNTNRGAILTCLSNNTVLSTATGQVFTSPGNDGTPLTVTSEGAVGWVVTRAGTVRNLYVRTGTTAKVNTPATAIVVRKNGVDTALTIAAMTQTTTTNSSDTTHSFTVTAGDVITVSLTTTGVAGVSTSIASITFEID